MSTMSITVLTADWAAQNPSADLPTGVIVALRPNAEGTWTGVLTERIPGVVYWWQRAITPTTNAPVPTAGDGFVVGDMVDGLGGGGAITWDGVSAAPSHPASGTDVIWIAPAFPSTATTGDYLVRG